MAEIKSDPTKKSLSLDWFVGGALTKIGETFDKLTGRNWKPSSSLATSELVERLKVLLDAEAKKTSDNKLFVPHNIKLKMQWDKFSDDAEGALKKLENELLIAAVDHINDKRYHTYAPMNLEIKPDYFTEGIRMLASFEEFSEDQEREAAINMSVPDLRNIQLNPLPPIAVEPEMEIYIAEFTVSGKTRKKELRFAEKQRLSVGRTKENDLWIDDQSVSKIHAAFVLNSDKQLMVADTGSTNGTFINNERIAYGKAIVIKDSDKLKFGTIEIALEHIVNKAETAEDYASEQITVNDKIQNSVAENSNSNDEQSAKTEIYNGEIKLPNKDSIIVEDLPTEINVRQTGQLIAENFDKNK